MFLVSRPFLIAIYMEIARKSHRGRSADSILNINYLTDTVCEEYRRGLCAAGQYLPAERHAEH